LPKLHNTYKQLWIKPIVVEEVKILAWNHLNIKSKGFDYSISQWCICQLGGFGREIWHFDQ